jgi:transcriptional regulator GlxA family with amidase domain
MPQAGPRTLGAVLYERFELLDLYGPLEMFGALGAELRIVTVAERKGPVASTPGVETGLLDGRRATSNKMYFQLARSQGERVEWVTAARWVEDGPFATSSGVSAGTDMALAVIARLYGRERAEQIAIQTEYSWHRDADRDPFAAYLDRGVAPPA